MKSMTNPMAAAVLVTVSMTANAWWGNPYGYNGVYGPVAPLTEEQREALTEQQIKAMQDAIEAQRRFAQQFASNQPRSFHEPFERRSFEAPADIAARREEMRKQMEARRAEMMRRVAEQRAFAQSNRSRQMPADITAHRDGMQKQAETRRAEMAKRVAEQRGFAYSSRDYQLPADVAARRDEMQKQVEARRAEMTKRSEEQRTARREAMEERR